MRCYCSCLRGDLGILLLREIISTSLWTLGIPALCPSSGTHMARVPSGWLLGQHWLEAVRDDRISDLFNKGVWRGSLFEQAP